MDMMLLGETVRGKNAIEYYGFWMPSGGDKATGGIDVTFLDAANFTVKLQTKNTEDGDPANSSTNIIGSASITATGVTKFDATGAKQLMRYVIVIGDAGSTDHIMHFQFMQPQWVPN